MMRKRMLYILLATSILELRVFAASPKCAPLGEERKAALVRYVERKFRLPENAKLTISAVADVEKSCYRKLRFESVNQRMAL